MYKSTMNKIMLLFQKSKRQNISLPVFEDRMLSILEEFTKEIKSYLLKEFKKEFKN